MFQYFGLHARNEVEKGLVEKSVPNKTFMA